MSKNNPIVSIIVPAYNVEIYIAGTLQSVVDQRFEDWELLIIDDGSTDDTANIVKSFSDARITLIQQENSGVSSARNKGLDLAKGKYITFLDADDVFPINSLKSRIEYLENNPDVDIVDGKIMVKDEEMKSDIRIYEPYYTGQLLPRLVALDSRVFFNICYMFKKDILRDLRFKDNMSHGEDLLFYIELSSLHPMQYGFVSEPIYWYRSGHISAMTNLQGLENGYISLVNYVSKASNISLIQKLIFRLKVAKIMFLSWLSQKKFLNALRSLMIMFRSYR